MAPKFASENSLNYQVQDKVGEPAILGWPSFARGCGRGLSLGDPAAFEWSSSVGRESESATFGEDGRKARPTTFEGQLPEGEERPGVTSELPMVISLNYNASREEPTELTTFGVSSSTGKPEETRKGGANR